MHEKIKKCISKLLRDTADKIENGTCELSLDEASDIVNGERKEFKQVPSNNAIADFGPDTFVLADNKDSLVNYVNATLQTSRNIVNSVDKHKKLISQYETILSELNPNPANDSAVRQLKEQVTALQGQLAEALSLLKGTNTNKNNSHGSNV